MVIALRAPVRYSLGIATTLTAGLLLSLATGKQECRRMLRSADTPAPAIVASPPPASEDGAIACDPRTVTAVLIRGQFTSGEGGGFAISFRLRGGDYAAITDQRGYFELRVPPADLDGDVCDLPMSVRTFSDDQMRLKYTVSLERE